jgi:hypothetical protein
MLSAQWLLPNCRAQGPSGAARSHDGADQGLLRSSVGGEEEVEQRYERNRMVYFPSDRIPEMS